MYKQGGLNEPPYILPFLAHPQHTTLGVCVVAYTVLVFSLSLFFHLHNFMHIYIYWNIYNSNVLSGYSPALYQLHQLSLESPHHCNLIALLVHPCGTSAVNVWEVIQKVFFLFFLNEVFLIPVPLVFHQQLCLMVFLLVLLLAPLGALLVVYLLCHQFFLWAHMACLRTVLPPPFFESLSTSSSPWVFTVCSEHMTPSIPLLHHPPDLMVQQSLVLLVSKRGLMSLRLL